MSAIDDPDYWRFAEGREGVMPASESGASEYPHWGRDAPRCGECGTAIEDEDLGCRDEECVAMRGDTPLDDNEQCVNDGCVDERTTEQSQEN